MNPTLQLLIDAFRQALSTPTENLVVTVFVLVMVLGAVTVFILGLLLVLTPRQRQIVRVRRFRINPDASDDALDSSGDEGPRQEGTAANTVADAIVSATDAESDDLGDEAIDVPESSTSAVGVRARTRLDVITGVVVGVLVLAAILSAYVITGTDTFCARQCHATQDPVLEARRVNHARCVSCHEQPGIAGIVPNVASRVRMISRSALSQGRPAGSAFTSSASCLRCHNEVLQKTVRSSRGIVMSHKEPVAAGMQCTQCHSETGHSIRRTQSMSTCTPCHGVSTKLRRCAVCHLGDPYSPKSQAGSVDSTQTMGSGEIVYPVVQVADIACGGCHNEKKTCDPCHGTRMPHSRKFIAGGHARVSAFERKAMCMKCHTLDSCSSGCHTNFAGGHGPTWRVTHGRAGSKAICACHAARSGRTTPMCALCHP